jgi:hypothetical protein
MFFVLGRNFSHGIEYADSMGNKIMMIDSDGGT